MPIENGTVYWRQILMFLWLKQTKFYQKIPKEVLKWKFRQKYINKISIVQKQPPEGVCKTSKNTFFTEHVWTTASDCWPESVEIEIFEHGNKLSTTKKGGFYFIIGYNKQWKDIELTTKQ